MDTAVMKPTISTRHIEPQARACCCPAAPVFVVDMPATATRPRSVDLLLCGHHYRASAAALAAAGATVYEVVRD